MVEVREKRRKEDSERASAEQKINTNDVDWKGEGERDGEGDREMIVCVSEMK